MEFSNFSNALLNWYDKQGRKNLPWRTNINPYRVWISEIMLQQTQVATVIPYFERFINFFPNVKTLAHASDDEVLNLWTGLGYYSRARNLHRTAKIIVNNYAGKFPKDLESLQNLPGIGRSTAGAILAIAFNQRTPILEGNVKRVLTRLHAITGWPGNPDVTKQLWQYALNYTPQIRTNDYTQAIMDLGATVCTRSKPCCALCPVQNVCQAFKLNKVNDFPTKNPKKKIIPVRTVFMLLIQNRDSHLLMEKRPGYGIWGGLWSFPECAAEEDISRWCYSNGLQTQQITHWQSFRHTFSHFHLDITPVHILIKQQTLKIRDTDNQIWYRMDKSPIGGFASPVKQLLTKLATYK